MKNLWILSLFFLGCVSCDLFLGQDPADDPLSVMEYTFCLFEDRYAGFKTEDKDWAELKAKSLAALQENPIKVELFEVLKTIMVELDDGHMRLSTDLGDFDLIDHRKYFSLPLIKEKYLRSYSTTKEKNLVYGEIDDHTGYLHISDFLTPEDEDLENIHDSAAWADRFENIMEGFLSKTYLIIDLRDNTGGDWGNGQKLLSHLISEKTELCHMYRKCGPGSTDFVLTKLTVTPSDTIFKNQLILLVNEKTMSTGDVVSIGIKEKTGAHLIGLTNRTETIGNSTARELPNGWVLTMGSICITVLDYEDGDPITVDENIENALESLDGKVDLQLEAALEWIQGA